jgi:zinc transport system substrate-binding protein
LLLLFALLHAAVAAAAPIQVVATIKPLQMIAAAVVGDRGDVHVLLDPRVSPHDYQLKPSDRVRLESADILFQVGPGLELFLQRTLRSLPDRVRVVALQPQGSHDQDAHIWMDPLAAVSIANRMAEELAVLRPEHARVFRTNAGQLGRALHVVDRELQGQFTDRLAQRRGYLVSHDAFGGFEQRYGLRHLATLSDGHERPPGPRHLLALQELVAGGAVGCVLLEPQYDPKLVDTVTGDRPIRRIAIDPMAGGGAVSAEGVLKFYRDMGQALTRCVRE